MKKDFGFAFNDEGAGFDWAFARGDKGGTPTGGPGGGNDNGTDDTVTYTYTSGATDLEADPILGAEAVDYFNIKLNFLGDGWTVETMSAIASAADYLSRLIEAGLSEDEGVDDLEVNLSLSDIDILGGTIAQGRPTSVRSSDGISRDGLPVTGEIIFDVNDVSALLERGSLDDLALHEMMHVLGLGTLWDTPGVRDFLSEPVFVPDLSTKNPKDGTTEIKYTGGAVDSDGALPLVETEGNLGHWDEGRYTDELMTTVFNVNGNYMSQMTAVALSDLGYAIDDTVAAELETTIELDSGHTIEDFAFMA